MSLCVGETIGGRYRILRLLGEGGMAKVVEVEHVDLGTRHALKLLTVKVPGIHERLMLEGRIQAQLQSPHIVPVTDVIRHGGAPGLVMHLIDGPALDQLLDVRRVNLRQADSLARGILRGMDVAHRNGCIHRDLKPANILLQVTDDDVVARVADFGLAKALEGDTRPERLRTVAGGMMGTPTFMAPEQFKDARSADARADLFSLGAILYELVTGTPAFHDAPMFDVYEQTRDEDYVRPSELEPALPGRMFRAIEACLRADPSQRPASCSELLELWEDGVPLGDQEIWSQEELAQLRALSPLRVDVPADGERVGFEPTLDFTGDDVQASTPPTHDMRPALFDDAPDPTLSAVSAIEPVPRDRVVVGLLIALPILGLMALGGLAITIATSQLLVAGTAGEGELAEAVGTEAAEDDRITAPPSPDVGVEAVGSPDPVAAPVAAPAPRVAPAPPPPTGPAPGPRVRPAPPDPGPAGGGTGVATGPAPGPPEPTGLDGETPPAAPAATGPSVRVEGVSRAHLIDGAGTLHAPGPVPTGRYDVWAFFENDRPTRVSEVTVRSDSAITIQCNPTLRTCR